LLVSNSFPVQQIIIRGSGCSLLSARKLKAEIEQANHNVKQKHEDMQGINSNYAVDKLSSTEKQKMKKLMKKEDDF
jgi:ribosomal protection tetracycline resistance protein